ncbi:MAG: 50S ribosomal protein L10 [Sulfolobaceae archaeon]|nr:50S ribosomal protein L10 [Sulfolobaceae archaeon]
MAVLARAKTIPKKKVQEVEYLTNKLKSSSAFLIASVEGFPADKLHEIRKRLRDIAEMRVTKNTLFKIALKNAGIDPKPLEKYLTGSNVFIFTNENPFSIVLALDKFKLKRYAIPGDKAEEEVVIPAGDTGMPAGPILSVFGKLKVQTRVQDGKVVVVKDTVIAKPGDPIPVEALPILQKLGIMPVSVKLKLKAAFFSGIVVDASQLVVNLKEYEQEIGEAYKNSFSLAVGAVLPLPEALSLNVQKAFRNAIALATEIGYITPETAQSVIAKAVAQAYAIASAIQGKVDLGVQVPSQQTQQQAQPQQEAKKEEKKEEEEKKPSEEDVGSSISSLFG